MPDEIAQVLGCDSASGRVSDPSLVDKASAGDALEAAKSSFKAGDLQEAGRLAEHGLALEPGNIELWNIYGVTLRDMGRAEASLACYQQVIELAPNSAGAWSNLGNSLKDLKHYGSAIGCHERAVALRPHNPKSFHNLGIALAAAGRHDDAIAAFHRALLLRRDDADIRWDRALSHLHLGQFAAGWLDYEARYENGLLPNRPRPGQRWAGQRYPGQRLVITAEQGFGDTIWASRFLSRAKTLGGELVMECQRELIWLLNGMGLVDSFVAKGGVLPEAAWHCSVCSLPGLFTPTAADISGAPYLTRSSKPNDLLARLLTEANGRFRVGIVWSGSTTFTGNANRAVTLERFVQAFSLPGVHLFSLQKGPQALELQGRSNPRLTDLAPTLEDFSDTAAAVAAMDLVIMTDSAVAHLAGAMGAPIWLLLGRPGYWLWQGDRLDSPWYSSMRLFRQSSAGDWTAAFDQAATALLDLTCKIERQRTMPPQILGPSL